MKMRWILLMLALPLLIMLCIAVGPVAISPAEIMSCLLHPQTADSSTSFILLHTRLPMTLCAISAGGALAVAGLLMQTLFRNPLAGPSILGVSTGASLGVAICALAIPAAGIGAPLGAIAGAALVLVILMALSTILRHSLALLIAGIMLSYLASSVISLLNYFAPASDVKSFAVWGMGSFLGVDLTTSIILISTIIPLLGVSMLFHRPLDALLLSETYASNMGYSVPRLRTLLLIISGILTALITAWCGPITFIGLTVPHLGRMYFRTSRHSVLLPACIIIGMEISLLCALLTVLPSKAGLLPINAVTPLIGVPVIIYLLLKRKAI